MKESIYRKKSLEKISSPEDLNSYMKVANPPIWIALVAIIIVLLGGIAWGIFGHLDTVAPALVAVTGDEVVCYVSESEIENIKEGMEVRCEDLTSEIDKIGSPVLASSILSTYAQHVAGFESGEYVYPCEVSFDINDGSYKAEIVVESVSAASFLWN